MSWRTAEGKNFTYGFSYATVCDRSHTFGNPKSYAYYLTITHILFGQMVCNEKLYEKLEIGRAHV